MKLESVAGLRIVGALIFLLTGAAGSRLVAARETLTAVVPHAAEGTSGPGPAAQAATGRPGREGSGLEAAFLTCVSLYGDPLAGALMRSIGERALRDSFVADHFAAVQSYSVERSSGYSTATATLKDGVAVAGVAARTLYASTCELDCALAVWGLEFGPLQAGAREALQAWADSAPATRTDTHGDIQVQLNTTTDGQTVLVCDVSD